MKARLTLALAVCVLFTGTVSSLAAGTNKTARAARPANWAQKIDSPGLPNLHQVTTNLYRGAQPTPEGMTQLKAMGVKTVINLRTLHSDRDEVGGTGLKSIRYTTQPWDSDDKDVIRFLKVVSDTNNLPAFVHCQRGADRTGTMCAMYRVAICGWTKQEAIEEMRNGGFAFSPVWKNLVRYVERADVEKLKREAGITEKN